MFPGHVQHVPARGAKPEGKLSLAEESNRLHVGFKVPSVSRVKNTRSGPITETERSSAFWVCLPATTERDETIPIQIIETFPFFSMHSSFYHYFYLLF